MKIHKNPLKPEQREHVEAVLRAAMAAADPRMAVRRNLQREGQTLVVAGESYRLDEYRHIYLVGFGKASQSMLRGVLDVLQNKITAGVVIAKHIDSALQKELPGSIEILEGSHPVPDEKSVQSTVRMIELLQQCDRDDLVICLISGGGSALLTQPMDGVSLQDIQQLTRRLLACGAEIQEINTIRKHLDRVKGGGLAGLAHPAQMVTLILSDVVGSPLDIIASGPTTADPSSFQDARDILQKYDLERDLPPAIIDIIEQGIAQVIPETPKAGHVCFERVHNVLVASNYLAAVAGVAEAGQRSMNALLLTTYMQGEAHQMGRFLAGVLRQVHETGSPIARPACLVIGGETTVILKGNGLGGRNLEVALGAVSELQGLQDVALVTLATDGEDGPTDAAGAVVSGETYRQALQAGCKPLEYLADNNSYAFFEKTGGLIISGPSGTNVNDLVILFAFS